MNFGYGAVGAGADIEQQVAAIGFHLGEEVGDLLAGHVVVGRLGGVVAEGQAQAPGRLPLHPLEMRARAVFDGAEVAVRRGRTAVEMDAMGLDAFLDPVVEGGAASRIDG